MGDENVQKLNIMMAVQLTRVNACSVNHVSVELLTPQKPVPTAVCRVGGRWGRGE